MRLYFRLLRVQLSQRFGYFAARTMLREDKKKALLRAALGVVVVISLLSLVGMYTWLLVSVMKSFQALGMERLLLGLALMVSMVVVFFMGMVYLIGILFFSKDTEFLAALPIPQRTVFVAKFSQVLLGEIGSGMLLLLPTFIVYGVMTGAGLSFWLLSAVTLLLAPCIPLALSAFLSLLLMRFAALWRRRDLMTIIGSVVLMAAIILGQAALSNFFATTIENPEALTQMIANSESLLRTVVSAFPPSGWAAAGILGDMGQYLLFLSASIVALMLVIQVAGYMYYRGASAQLETAAKLKRIRLTGGAVRRHGVVFTLFIREWRAVLRSPVYALNGLAVIVMGPLMMVMPMLMQGASSGNAGMDELFALLNGLVDKNLVVLILAALFVAIGGINPAATTSISREGKQFFLLRTIPVTPFRQALAKFLFGFSVTSLAMLLMGAMSLTMLKIPLDLMLPALLLGLLGSIAPLSLSMVPDFLRPKLSWGSETEAIKQNLNSMMGMFISWGYVALLVAGCFLGVRAGISLDVLLWMSVGVAALLGAIGMYALSKAARRSLRVIEG